jgi:hypothetical protein
MSNQRALDTSRRHFLRTLSTAGGAAAAAMALPTSSAAAATGPGQAAAEKRRGYRETEHVRAYYASARD